MNPYSLFLFFCYLGRKLIVFPLSTFSPPVSLADITCLGRADEELFLGLFVRVHSTDNSLANGNQSQRAGFGLSKALTLSGSNAGDHKVLNTSGKGF